MPRGLGVAHVVAGIVGEQVANAINLLSVAFRIFFAEAVRTCRTSPTGWFYEGKCQEKYFSAELKPDENWSWHSAPVARVLPVCGCPTVRGRVIADQTGVYETADDFYCLAFPSCWKALFRTARSGPGRADRRGEASLDGEDRSELMGKEGKQGCATGVDF